MKYKFEDYYGIGRLVGEDGSYINITDYGILVRVGSVTGKIYSIPDASSHNAGHGMGSMKSCQGIISPFHMNLIVIQNTWADIFDIEVLE